MMHPSVFIIPATVFSLLPPLRFSKTGPRFPMDQRHETRRKSGRIEKQLGQRRLNKAAADGGRGRDEEKRQERIEGVEGRLELSEEKRRASIRPLINVPRAKIRVPIGLAR